MEEIEGAEDKAEGAVSIKHCSNINPDNARRVIVMVRKYG